MGVTVRKADAGDIDWMVSRFQEHSDEYPSEKSLYNPEQAPRALIDGIVNHLVLVAERDGERLGYIAGWVNPHFFNPDLKVLTQALWYVVPGVRGGRAALELLRAFDEYGEKYCDWVWLCLPLSARIKDKSLKRRGYHLIEKWYLKEV